MRSNKEDKDHDSEIAMAAVKLGEGQGMRLGVKDAS
jgi:hypothetical protein